MRITAAGVSLRLLGRTGFKVDHRFIRPGVAEFFPRQPFHRFRVVAERINFRFELFGDLFLLLQFSVEPVHLGAHPFVFTNERQIRHANENQYRKDDEDDDRLRELAPDAEINFHAASLTARAKSESGFCCHRPKIG